MARIRTIKPEFFTSESVCNIEPLARLLFIALWCEADKEGKLIWKPKTIKLRYFPSDKCDIDKLAQQLIDEKMIVVYEVDEVFYCSIPTFSIHQVINNRERESELPNFIDASTTRELRVKAEGRKEGKERKGMEGNSASLAIHDLVENGIDEQLARDYLALRKSKQLPLTITAFEIVVNEGLQCGLTPNQTIKTCIANSWAGFKAEWYNKGAVQ